MHLRELFNVMTYTRTCNLLHRWKKHEWYGQYLVGLLLKPFTRNVSNGSTHQSGPGRGRCRCSSSPSTPIASTGPNDRVLHQHGFHPLVKHLHPRTALRSILKLHKYLEEKQSKKEAEHKHVDCNKSISWVIATMAIIK